MPRPFVPIPHGIEGVIHAHAPGLMSPSAMTFGFFADNALPDALDMSNVAGLLGTWLVSDFGGLPASQVIFDDITVRSLAEHFGPQLVTVVGAPASGGDGDIGAMTVEVLLHSGEVGRSFNGRSYTFFPPRSAIDSGFWSSTYVAQIQSAYDTLISNAGGALYPLSVPSRTLQVMTGIRTASARQPFSYQTRRDPNRG